MMTDAQLAAMRARLKAAPEKLGLGEVTDGYGDPVDGEALVSIGLGMDCGDIEIRYPNAIAYARLIAEAPTDLAALLAEVDRLRGLLAGRPA